MSCSLLRVTLFLQVLLTIQVLPWVDEEGTVHELQIPSISRSIFEN